jgi:hypothetical protein
MEGVLVEPSGLTATSYLTALPDEVSVRICVCIVTCIQV